MGLVAVAINSVERRSLQKKYLLNIYDASILNVDFQHHAKIISSEWLKTSPRQQCLLQLAVSLSDRTVSVIESSSDGIRWSQKVNVLRDCQLKNVTVMRVLPATLSHNPLFLLASDDGEVQVFCAKEFKAKTNAVSLSIQPICDIQFSKIPLTYAGCRYMLVAY